MTNDSKLFNLEGKLTIVYINGIDAVAKNRSSMDSTEGLLYTALSQLFIEMTEDELNKNLVFIFATDKKWRKVE